MTWKTTSRSDMAQVHASEGLTHWYDRDGAPRYTIVGKNGKERNTTLRDAREHGYVPSVTTVLKCADKPALNDWKANQLMLAALTLSRLDGESEEAWLRRVKEDSKETARKAAERGTAIHAAIQGFYEGETSRGYEAHIDGAVDAVTGWLKSDWRAERSFASPLGYGGKVDLSCSVGVLDFKTKEFGPDSKLDVYDEHFMQLAAYRHGLGIPQARCAIVYVSVTNPGLARLIEIEQDDLTKGWKMFYSLLQFWKARCGFESSFERMLAA